MREVTNYSKLYVDVFFEQADLAEKVFIDDAAGGIEAKFSRQAGEEGEEGGVSTEDFTL